MKLVDDLSKRSKLLLMAMGLALTFSLGILDYLTGLNFDSLIFYLIPVFLVAWFVGRWAAILISTLSAVPWAVPWFAQDAMTMRSYSHPAFFYWSAATRMGILFSFALILSETKNAFEREKAMARMDPLTGMANRRSFFNRLETELDRTHRDQRPFTIAYLDLDNFKEINDRFGHRLGDILLGFVADAMKDHVRETDVTARLGGDEFAVLLPETGYEPGRIMLRKIQNALLQVMQKNDWAVTISIGAVTCMNPTCTLNELMKRVDDLMYGVKSSGKNKIRHETFDREE